MTDDDGALRARFAEHLPTARDPVFLLATLDRIERRRLRTHAAMMILAAIAVALLAPAASALIGAWNSDIGLYAFAAAVLVSLWLVRRDLPGAAERE